MTRDEHYELNLAVAKAEGLEHQTRLWKFHDSETGKTETALVMRVRYFDPKNGVDLLGAFEPSEDAAQAMELMVKHCMTLTPEWEAWRAEIGGAVGAGDTPQEAICLCVLALASIRQRDEVKHATGE